jgi:hypothetical protein
VTFRDRLLATLRRLRSVLEEPGVLIVGSEVPNLLQPGAASTLVVSQDVDLAVPLERLEAVKRHLRLVEGLAASREEPSVYVPQSPELIEVNFLGWDPRVRDAADTYVFDDPELPLMVFGPLGLVRPGPAVEVDGLRLPLPRPGDLIIEKLLTDRTGEKGVRDLLVVAGLLAVSDPGEIEDMLARVGELSAEARHAMRSNLTVLSLLSPQPSMPDPIPMRERVAALVDAIGGIDD